MKVLFAVNNDEISNAIVKKYQKEYKEILSYKNVYYFNAILKELQKDKTYDRVVISEDLEPFANNNYDTIDKFLFDKLDNISDEAIDAEGKDTNIILICTDRRSKSEEMLVKIFGIGIYSAIVGQDRSIDEVCRLINKPRSKKEAKSYYRIEADNVNYQSENEDSVSEIELQNILSHYKRLGRNEDKYVDSFNNIASQYTDKQLKIIVRYLPIGVKAVLEERCPKYQELVSFEPKANKEKTKYNQYNNIGSKKEERVKVKILDEESTKIDKPILIPTSVNKSQVKRLIKPEETIINNQKNEINEKEYVEEDAIEEPAEEKDNIIEEQKRGRGRPKKITVEPEEIDTDKPRRGRGRPKKSIDTENLDRLEENTETPKEIEKIELKSTDELVDLFNLPDDPEEMEQEYLQTKKRVNSFKTNKEKARKDQEVNLFELGKEQEDDEEVDLFELGKEQEEQEDDEEVNLFELGKEQEEQEDDEEVNLFELDKEVDEDNNKQITLEQGVIESQNKKIDSNFNSVLIKDKKVISFVGTTKNGTSFIVNNVAHLLASRGISTAVLDMTKTRNAYYIYTNSEEKLMETAKNCIYKLRSGIADGINVNKNLTIYTSVPEDDSDYSDVESIIGTLVKNYSVVLIDCDFDTPMEYFAVAQEIYLVQSMDVLTIQPLTAFLRNLQSKNILKQEKLRVVINKGVKIRSISINTLIGGISKYNDPSMTYMKDLFDKDKTKYCIIPFEVQNYIKYLDSLITCSITLNGYTKPFISALNELCNMIYPLINKQIYSPRGDKYKDNFSSEMNDTLSKMKKKYQ